MNSLVIAHYPQLRITRPSSCSRCRCPTSLPGAHSLVAVGKISIGNTGFVTAQVIRSSKNVISICVVSLLLPTSLKLYWCCVTSVSVSGTLSFVSMWLFEANNFVNSMLVLFKSARQKAVQIIYVILVYIRAS